MARFQVPRHEVDGHDVSAHGPPRPDATPLNILINEPQVNAGGSIEWHATARNPDQFGSLDLTVNIICVDSNNGEVHPDESTDESDDETDDLVP